MGFISNFFRRRKLVPVVKTLPHVLKHRYGANEYYSVGQVNTVAAMLGLKENLILYAFAVACDKRDFKKVIKKLSADDYLKLREEIAELFYIEERQLNCKSLVERFRYRRPSYIRNLMNNEAYQHGGNLPPKIDSSISSDGGSAGGD